MELDNINNDKLKYVYYECFNKENNKFKMIKDLKNLKFDNKRYKNLYNILKLISSTKK